MPDPTVIVPVPDNALLPALLGPADQLLRLMEAAFPATDFLVRGNEFTISGPDATQAARLVEEQVRLLLGGHVPTAASVAQAIDMVKAGERPSEVLSQEVLRSSRGRSVRPKTSGQKRYVDAIHANTVTFGIGPAGTGKSYLAVAVAVEHLQAKKVERIILTRPAVEAGERLGFLPGDLLAKVDPYLRPLYDALYDMLSAQGTLELMQKGIIEIAPLAYMRGRAQPVATPVLTPWGFRPIGSLQVGDLVVGANGLPTPVLGVYPQGVRDVFSVRAEDGASTLATADHLWSVGVHGSDGSEGSDGAGCIVTTAEMIEGLTSRTRRRYELPLVGTVEMEPGPVPTDPYALGVVVGGGPGAEGAWPAPAEQIHHGAGGIATVLPVLRPAGSGAGLRSVPRAYLYNSSDVRIALLQGLLDAGGRPVGRRGSGRSVEFQGGSSVLCDQVLFLVRSLGGVGRPRRAGGRYFLDIDLPERIEPFRSRAKAKIHAEAGGGRPRRFVDSIEPAGEDECVCIAVGAADSLYVTEDLLVTHNTLNNAFIILDEAQNATREQMKMFLTRIGFGSKAVVTGDASQVDLEIGKSGIHGLENILEGIDGLAFMRLTSKDVVRHKIVQDIVDAYDRFDDRKVR